MAFKANLKIVVALILPLVINYLYGNTRQEDII